MTQLQLNNLSLESIGNNQVVITMGTEKIFFSYNTPVIAIDYSNNFISLMKGFDYSVTTNKYTNKMLYCFTVADIKKAYAKKETIKTQYNEFTIIDER